MISYFLGIPGAGKTYFSADTIYKHFSLKSNSKKYDNCYTNINEFKFDLVENVYNYDHDIFMEKITILYNMYRKKVTDRELIDKAKEFGIHKTLYVLDECHKYFDVENKILVWLLTYHRHLYIDLMMITQNMALINSKYKPLGEAYYKAKSRSLTLGSKSFKYMYYASYPINKGTFVNTITLNHKKEVFNLYKSGDSVKSKNVIKRFIYISIFMALFLAFLIYLYSLFNSTRIEEFEQQNDITHSEKVVKNKKSYRSSSNIDSNDFISDKSHYVVFDCGLSSCSSSLFVLPVPLFVKFQKMEKIHSFYYEELSKTLYRYHISMDDIFYNFLLSNSTKGAKDEIATNSSIDLFKSDSK
jgi:zona occludens toxin